MTGDEFTRSMESYYRDDYGPDAAGIVQKYLAAQEKNRPGITKYIYAEALKSIPRRFKVAPGLAELEEVKQAAVDNYEAAKARARALAAPDRVQIEEDTIPPDLIAKLLDDLYQEKRAAADRF